jgi:hypothetical protein
MRVGDLKDLDTGTPWVDLKGSKSAAARRSLPIHSQALSIYLRRSEGKGMDDYLLHELPTPAEGSAMERGQKLTKEFGRLRERLGIGEKEDGDGNCSDERSHLIPGLWWPRRLAMRFSPWPLGSALVAKRLLSPCRSQLPCLEAARHRDIGDVRRPDLVRPLDRHAP